MEFMANELANQRPPANIMTKIKLSETPQPAVNQAKPETKATLKINQNDPCHCGSGKKFKNCCRNKRISN